MPTIKQMNDLWDAEMYWNEVKAKADSAPLNIEFTGQRIGVVQYDAETHELRVIVDKDAGSAGVNEETR